MANEAAAHREFDEKIARKYELEMNVCVAVGKRAKQPSILAVRAIDEAVRTALEKAAQVANDETSH